MVEINNQDPPRSEEAPPSVPPTEPMDAGLSLTAKVALLVGVVAGLGLLAVVFHRRAASLPIVDKTPTVAPRVSDQPKLYQNLRYAYQLELPPGWVAEPKDVSLASASFAGVITLRDAKVNPPCLDQASLCPIEIQVFPLPAGRSLTNLPGSISPDRADIYGGTEGLEVGGYPGLLLLNIRNTGGQIVFVQRGEVLVRLALQHASEVPYRDLKIFREILSSLVFGQ